MEHFFSTFCHISDYGNRGYSLLPYMLETSYPLVLWAPPGAQVNECYRSGICPLAPEKLIKYVEEGFIRIIGREKWLLDEHYRRDYADSQPFATWHDNFDGALKSIWQAQRNMPVDQQSVIIAPEEDGWEWAKTRLQEEPKRIDTIWKCIETKRIPLVSLKRIERYNGDKEQSVLQVLRDARNHTKAIRDLDVDLPLLLHENEGRFFRFLEKSGANKLPQNRPVAHQGLHPDFLEEVDRLLMYMRNQEKFSSLDDFLGSQAHKDLAKWLHATVQLAQFSWSSQQLKTFLVGQLKHDIEQGLQRTSYGDVLGKHGSDKVATVGGLLTGIASLFLSGIAFDPNTMVSLGGLGLNVVPIITGISRQLGVIKPEYTGPQWPYLVRFHQVPKKRDIGEVKAILDTLLAVMHEK